MSNSLDPDQVRRSVGTDLGPNCLQRLSADDKRQAILKKNSMYYNNEPVHEISYNVVCVTSKASNQPAHMRSLIKAFASRSSIL